MINKPLINHAESSAIFEPIPNIIVKDSAFIRGITHISQSPNAIFSEIAILGRSNVGKSSLINGILNQNLAKSSQTPGKTKEINFFQTQFILENVAPFNLMLVDFPGFGYAKISKEQKRAWDRNLSEFLKKRESILLFIHLIDSRHRNLAKDNEIRAFLKSILRPNCKVLEVFTKVDKLNKKEKSYLNNEITTSKSDKSSFNALRMRILKELYAF